MKIRKELVVILLVLSVAIVSAVNSGLFTTPKPGIDPEFHTPRELEQMKKVLGGGPIEPGEYFLHSTTCEGCHGHDTLRYANVDYDTIDVNVFDDWRATMMSNSSRDPLWRAKVTHEILLSPSHSDDIQNFCTSCHAPMGHYTSKYKGNLYYTLSDLYNDSLGLDGVSCLGCHMVGEDSLGSLFSGKIPYDTTHVIYGPFQNPVAGPMQLYIGMDPTYSLHFSEGKMCSSCHTLISDALDLSGNPTGNTFVEQATYHEWVNSTYFNDFVSCQNCHMPEVIDSVVLANGYLNLPPRSPFNRHKFQGANEFMLKLMKENKERLGVTATDENYDSTIAVTNRMLRYQTLNMQLTMDSLTIDTAFFTVRLTNKAGHKFPSGYPSRRAVLQFVLVGSANDTIFKSGMFDNTYEVEGIDATYEPHYDIISSPNQAQIYEMVAGDVTGTRTTVLTRMDTTMKDNRIPPEGFNDMHNSYDTVRIVGNASTDPNFNINSSNFQGTGRDEIHYHVPINNYSGTFSAYTHIYYQAVPPRFVEDLFTHSTAEIDTFEVMYNASDQSPVWMVSDSILNMALGIQSSGPDSKISVYPDPTSDGWITIEVPDELFGAELRIYDATGRAINTLAPNISGSIQKIRLPEAAGTYILEIRIENRQIRRKIIRQ